MTVLIADLALRPLLRQKLYVRPHKMFSNPWPTNEGLQRYDRNVGYAGRIHGDLAVMHGDPRFRAIRRVEFRTDELGFRNEPGSAGEDNRLLLVGDSFGVGSGGTQSDTLARILEDTHQIKSYNLSVGGFSPWQGLMTLKYELARLSLAPDAGVLWLLFSGNDLDSPNGSDFELSYNSFSRRHTVRLSTAYKRSPIRLLLQPKANLRNLVVVRTLGDEAILFYAPYVQRVGRTEEEVRAHKNLPSLRRVFEHMAEFCRSNRLRLYVVLVPSKAETYSWVPSASDEFHNVEADFALSRVLEQWSEDLEVPFLDLSPHFAQTAETSFQQDRTLLYWRDDTHWNGHGQRLAARLIVAFLRGEQAMRRAAKTLKPLEDRELAPGDDHSG